MTFAPCAQAVGVYKWTDAQGRMHYDDSNVLEQRLTQEYLDARRIPGRNDATTPSPFVDQVQRRCELIRERLKNYRSATRLEGRGPDGNSYPLSPRQVQIEIATTARDEAHYCAPGAAEKIYREPLADDAKVTPVEQR